MIPFTLFGKEVDKCVQFTGTEKVSHLCATVESLVDDPQPTLTTDTGVQHSNLSTTIPSITVLHNDILLVCQPCMLKFQG